MKQLQNNSSFGFPTIFYGRQAFIDVVWNDGHYGVLINGEHAARLEHDDDDQTWFVAAGELDDYDLVQEIGSRIEAYFFCLKRPA